METYYEAKPGMVDKSAIALGFFDGVHPGHKSVISKAIEDAKSLDIPCGVVTFKDHPRTLTRGKSPMLLTVIEQRLGLIEKLGVDFALVLAFTEELCLLSPQEYVKNVLVDSIGAKSISVGHNHHFGKDREGDAALLAKLGEKLGYTVNVAPMISVSGSEVSSSRIRQFIESGSMQEASTLLARPFAVRGKVARGDGRGKQIGFPTANLDVYEYQMIPKRGVYAGEVHLSNGTIRGCVVNVGLRPTFHSDQSKVTIEAHIFDLDETLYGKTLEVDFLEFLREEKKFDSKDDLINQIGKDKQNAIQFLENKQQKLHA